MPSLAAFRRFSGASGTGSGPTYTTPSRSSRATSYRLARGSSHAESGAGAFCSVLMLPPVRFRPCHQAGRTEGSILRLDPLRAWRFVAGKVSALGAVTSPPYDVLEPALVRRLTDSDLHNMVRLILPRDPDLGPGRYDEPARRLAGWQRDGVVVQDPRPALYVYEQQLGSAVLCGLVGSLGLDPARRVVLPHEDVMPHWVDDRLELMEATDADLEPILLAYGDGGAASDAVDNARSGEPWVVADTYNGAHHRIWRIEDPSTLAMIAAELARARGADRGRPPPLCGVPGTPAARTGPPECRDRSGDAGRLQPPPTHAGPDPPRRTGPGPRHRPDAYAGGLAGAAWSSGTRTGPHRRDGRVELGDSALHARTRGSDRLDAPRPAAAGLGSG